METPTIYLAFSKIHDFCDSVKHSKVKLLYLLQLGIHPLQILSIRFKRDVIFNAVQVEDTFFGVKCREYISFAVEDIVMASDIVLALYMVVVEAASDSVGLDRDVAANFIEHVASDVCVVDGQSKYVRSFFVCWHGISLCNYGNTTHSIRFCDPVKNLLLAVMRWRDSHFRNKKIPGEKFAKNSPGIVFLCLELEVSILIFPMKTLTQIPSSIIPKNYDCASFFYAADKKKARTSLQILASQAGDSPAD